MSVLRFRLAFVGIVSLWLALRIFCWNGYYTEDAPGYVTDAIWMALGEYRVRTYVNGLNVGTYLPVALPIWMLGKSEIAIGLWPLACSLLGLLSVTGSALILFGRPFGLLAAFLYATYPGDIFFSTVVMPDAMQAGWVSFSVFLIMAAYIPPESRRNWMLASAGVAMGMCHLIRANDVVLLPVGVFAVLACSRIRARRRLAAAALDCVIYAGGWMFVVVIEGFAYLLAIGNFFLRFHVVHQHYGGLDSIARAGLNIDPRTIPFSLFPPVTWWLQGGWGQLSQDQAYHGLLFCWAVGLLAIGATAVWRTRKGSDPRALGGFAVAVAWLFWPLLYHQFGSQSLSQMVPMHRLSRHLVVYAPGAMFAIVAGCFVACETLRSARTVHAPRIAVSVGLVGILVHSVFNWQGEQIAFASFHQIKDTYVRIREHLPEQTHTIVADPGDLCFLDFWMNPLRSQQVRMVPFAAYARCDQIEQAAILVNSNPGWHDGAPVIKETVRRLPCLIDPPSTWKLVYQGYPETIFEVSARSGNGKN